MICLIYNLTIYYLRFSNLAIWKLWWGVIIGSYDGGVMVGQMYRLLITSILNS